MPDTGRVIGARVTTRKEDAEIFCRQRHDDQTKPPVGYAMALLPSVGDLYNKSLQI